MPLARHLAGRSENAEDAVQATFLTAIERSDTHDPTFPLQPWLTGILVRKARESHQRPAEPIDPDRVDDPVLHASRGRGREPGRGRDDRLPRARRLRRRADGERRPQRVLHGALGYAPPGRDREARLRPPRAGPRSGGLRRGRAPGRARALGARLRADPRIREPRCHRPPGVAHEPRGLGVVRVSHAVAERRDAGSRRGSGRTLSARGRARSGRQARAGEAEPLARDGERAPLARAL